MLKILVTVTTTTNAITLRGYNTGSVDNLRGINVTTPPMLMIFGVKILPTPPMPDPANRSHYARSNLLAVLC